MDNMVLWLVIGAAVVIAGISVMLLQKKAGEAKKYAAELNSIKSQLNQKNGEILESERSREVIVTEEKNRAEDLARELSAAKNQITQLTEELDNLKSFQAGRADGQEKLEVELSAVKEQLRGAEEQRDKNAAQLAERSQKSAETQNSGDAGIQEELAALKAELEIKEQKLASAEKDFAAQMDEVVQSSMEKIIQSEQAKEEAIQAAQDNFEAAAETNVKLREAEAKLAKLQG